MNKDSRLINKLDLKRELFNLYENARVLFNDYYNGKECYTEEDVKNIYDLILKIQENVDNIESEIN